ncbi:MAG TPA: two-component regulator propeller domain-containing protein [Bacteroidales bacterium]|mgnify:CR=1 FL=1|nr:two-component regulator propeller domain-containing protein [Bacteroidales bacterium]
MKKLLLTLCVLMLGALCSVNAQFTNYTVATSDLPSDYVGGGIAIDTNNNVWVGTDSGVAKFDGTNWTVFTMAVDGLPSDIITCLAVDRLTNNIWIGTDGDGVAKYDGAAWTTYTVADGICDNGIHYIAGDNNGCIWFGSWGSGISKLEDTTWTTYNAGNGFPEDQGSLASVYYIHVDASNNKWFGTDLGLVKYNNIAFTTTNQTTTPELVSNYIMAVAVDASDNKWLGVQFGGLAKLNSSNTWVANYDTTNGLVNMGVTDIKFDSHGNMWLGAYTQYGAFIEGGITKFNTVAGSGISITEADGLVDDQVFAIAIDQDNAIWAATGGGLSKYIDASGIKENYKDMTLDICPNPVNETLNISGNINSGIAVITDITGKIIFNQAVSSPVIINTENFGSGIYFIKITEKESVYTGKFIKK